jgi:hypothetical protein
MTIDDWGLIGNWRLRIEFVIGGGAPIINR